MEGKLRSPKLRTRHFALSGLLLVAFAMSGPDAYAENFDHTSSTHRWTNISGEPGEKEEWLAPNNQGFYSLSVHEKSDDPRWIELQANTLSSDDPRNAGSPDLKVGANNVSRSNKTANVGSDHYVTAVQVCVNNDKIKGVRLWGKTLTPAGLPNREKDDEFTRANCNGKWQTKVSCGPEKVATGLRAYRAKNSFGGLALRCSKIES